MSEDASFADGAVQPLRLVAADAEDLKVVSSLLQDAVFVGEDVTWQAASRRFAVLVNRFRWEDRATLKTPERVRTVLVIDDVTGVRSQGFDPKAKDVVLSLLAVDWDPVGQAGQIVLTLAGDGVLAVQAEAVNVTLRDVTRPYAAPSGKRPEHPE